MFDNSKFPLILGAFLGFSITFVVGMVLDNPVEYTLRNASIASIIGAMMMKFLEQAVLNGLSQVKQKQAMEESLNADEQESEPPSDSKQVAAD